MTRARFAATVVAVAALTLVGATSAGAASNQGGLTVNGNRVTTLTIPARFAGQLTVAYHGDSASGCASRGLCGYAGTVSWRPPATGSLAVFEYREHGHIAYSVNLNSFPTSFPGTPGGVTTANEQLSASASIVSTCVDAVPTGASIPLPVRRGRVSFPLAGGSPALLSTGCAGPLDADVMPDLPVPTPALGTVLHGGTTVSLAADRSFASHGFAGTVQSDLTISLGRPGRTSSQTSQTSHQHQVEVLYRATVSGSVIERVHGAADSRVCALLGSCGLSGTLTLEPKVTTATADIYASAPSGRPYRDLLTAVGASTGGNPKGIQAIGTVAWARGGVLAADLAQASTTCLDSVPLGPAVIFLGAAKGLLGASYLPGLGTSAVRTRCPGPSGTNNGANGAYLAAGEVPRADLRRRTFTIVLNRGGTSVDYGYAVRTAGHLTLTLTREHVRTGVGASVSSFGSNIFAIGS